MAALEVFVDDGGHAGQGEGGLRDVVARGGGDAGGEIFALGEGGVRADEHAIAAAFVGSLDDEFVEIFEHVLAIRIAPAEIGGNVGQDRLFALVVADHVRDVGVDDFVIGHAVAWGIGERDAAISVGFHQSRDAEEGIGAEGFGIEEIIVHAAVDDVDAFETPGGAHEDVAADDDEVAPFDELDAHLLREEAVLEVGGVVDAGGEDDDARDAARAGRERFEHFEELAGVLVDGADGQAFEDAGEDALEHLAIFQHVADAGGDAEIVLEDVVFAIAAANQVRAGDVAPDTPRGFEAAALGSVGDGAGDDLGGDGAILENSLLVVDVVDEGVEGVDALLEAAFDAVPLGRGDDPRDEIEGKMRSVPAVSP